MQNAITQAGKKFSINRHWNINKKNVHYTENYNKITNSKKYIF